MSQLKQAWCEREQFRAEDAMTPDYSTAVKITKDSLAEDVPPTEAEIRAKRVVIHKFSDVCPECGPNGTKPIQSLRDWVTVEPCKTCAAKEHTELVETGRKAAQRRERAVLDAILSGPGVTAASLGIPSHIAAGSVDGNYSFAKCDASRFEEGRR